MERRVGSRYVLEERIGVGGMGEVWRGRATDSGDVVAIKILHANLAADTDNIDRFLRERRVLLEIANPNVVRLFDLVAEGSTMAIVMEYVGGGDLRSFTTKSRGLSWEHSLHLLIGLVEGLRAIHLSGVIHRDIKPQNVLVDVSSGRPVAKVGDFGIVRVVSERQVTQDGHMIGTPAYMAPETLEGHPATTSTDLYAAGCVLYEVMAGRPPFVGTQAAIMMQHASERPKPINGLPPVLWHLIERMLDKNPAVRPTASETVLVLREVSGAGNSVAAPSAVAEAAAAPPWWLPPFVARSNEMIARAPVPGPPAAPNDEWWTQ